MPEPLTRVEIVFLKTFVNHRLRFGDPLAVDEIDRRRGVALFTPGSVFGYIRWEANKYGTRLWRLTVMQAGRPGDALDRVPGVDPGGGILLDLSGAARVKRGLALIDAIEASGIDPKDVSPAWYRHAHNRILTRQTLHAYGPEQHRAHLAARALRP